MTMTNDDQFWPEFYMELRGTLADCSSFGRDDLLAKVQALKDEADARSIAYMDAQDKLNDYLRELHPIKPSEPPAVVID